MTRPTNQKRLSGDSVQTKAKKIALLLFGWGFILLGAIGMFLPILQGVLFLMIGLLILSSEYVWAHRLLLKIRNRFPSVAKRWDEARVTAHKWIARVSRSSGQPVR
jgi:uncharacterized membrane protein YbaN (DUF454 family)